jgi:protein-tyrosine phosphatase
MREFLRGRLVDIHSHILPGIDDGAQTIEESLEMLKLAAAAGTTDIVATPHANSQYVFNVSTVERLLAQLSANAGGLITLHRGCDFHLNFENLIEALEYPGKYTINNSRYLMVELPELFSLPAVRSALLRLRDVGLTPVITHPERNQSLTSHLKDLEGWVLDGCLLQITAQSLLGRFGPAAQRTSESLLTARLAHFVASDAHDCIDRPPDLSAAYQLVRSRWGAGQADALFIHNPAATLVDEPVISSPAQSSKKLSFFAFWK